MNKEAEMKRFLIVLLLLFGFVSICAEIPETTISSLLPDALGVNVVTRMVGENNYHFVSYHDEFGNIGTKIFNSDFVEVQEDEIPISKPNVIFNDVLEAFEKNPMGKQRLLITLAFPVVHYPEHDFSSEDYVDDLGNSFTYVDGRLIDEFQEKLLKEEYDRVQNEYRSELSLVKSLTWQELREKNTNPDFNEAMEIAQNYERSYFVAEMTQEDMFELLENAGDLIDGIDLDREGEEELTNAMLATSVDPFVLSYTSRQGNGIGIYMTEPSCPPDNYVTNYYRIDNSVATSHSQKVARVIRSVSPRSFLYCKSGSDLPDDSELSGYEGNPAIKVITMSAGKGDTNLYTSLTKDWDQFSYNNDVIIFKSAGNKGEESGNVTVPGGALNIISVGNYVMQHITHYNNAPVVILPHIKSTSSFNNPETGNQKPEVVAPATDLIINGSNSTGTSFAAPHVAAITADYMGSCSWLVDRPHYTKAFILNAATDFISSPYDKRGEGGVDYITGYLHSEGLKKEGDAATNAQWNAWDANDAYPNNGYIDRTFYVNTEETNKVGLALSWITRGQYTYDHRNDTYPLGIDLDMCVYDPNGSLIDCSTSKFNSYEIIRFTPASTGTYRVKISKYDLRDSDSKFYFGLRINKYE